MASIFSNMAFVQLFRALIKPGKNPIIKWWVENNFPWDYLAFLDDGPFLNGARVSEKDVLHAWIAIGFLQNGFGNLKLFLKRYNTDLPPVSRKRKLVAVALLLLFVPGLLYLFQLIDSESVDIFTITDLNIAVIVFLSYGYYDLYRRLIYGRLPSRSSLLVALLLAIFITVALTSIISGILSYAGLSIKYVVDTSNYSLIQRMMISAVPPFLTWLLMLLVFEIYLRASLKLIRKKLAM
jgi:hypothetical protein